MTEWVRDNRTGKPCQCERRSRRHHAPGGLPGRAFAKAARCNRIYGEPAISERHRHRYEVNINYRDRLEEAGLLFSGLSPDGELPEIVELRGHPWFIGVQFHPELKSKPFEPHPLFMDFIRAAVEQSRLV